MMKQGIDQKLWRQIRWPLRLTMAGLWAERITHAFWPLWTAALALIAAFGFQLDRMLSLEVWWFGLLALAFGLLGALVWGIWRFRRPRGPEALARIDLGLRGRPLQSLSDAQALGLTDDDSRALWAAHQAKMAAQAAEARAVAPDLRLSRVDPFALRYVALTAFVMMLLFGSVLRVAVIGEAGLAGTQAVAQGPAWEGWAEPPYYTGKPRIYLNDQAEGALRLPAGTKLTIKLYGAPGDLILSETVSGRTVPTAASDAEQSFVITKSGKLAIEGDGGREWRVDVITDAPPSLTLQGEIGREADGKFKQSFKATDDYGVMAGKVTIALDLGAVERRFGLTLQPEAIVPVTLDLPMPIRGNRKDFTEILKDDLSQSILANMPVIMTFSVTDAATQTFEDAPVSLTLPGRRFFDPMAAAVIEMRRDLMWNRANAPRVVQVMKAITHRPEELIRNQRAYLRLRVLIRDLNGKQATLAAEDRDLMAVELWEIALLIEDGDLASALDRMQRAQDRLAEAIKRGASPEEIQELMDEMRQALDKYLAELAEQQGEQGQESAQNGGPRMEMSANQLQEMFDKLQELMEQGKTAEAAELMEQLRQFMQNMQVAQGEGGQGGPGSQAMRGLQDTLRDQQKLADDAFRDLQDGQEGNQPGESDGKSLAERQKELAEKLGEMNRNGGLPGPGSEKGEAGRKELGRAGEAMDQAEEALKNGDLPGALDKQADAIDAMREGMRNFGEALADNQREGQPGETERAEGLPPREGLDPLGREPGNALRIGSDENMMQNEDVYRRAQELLDEIRERAGDQGRSETERGYLDRLLNLF
jgi:uncharacterized protein (TIGR02302 family)